MHSVFAGHVISISCTASIGGEDTEHHVPAASQGGIEASASNHSADEVSPCCKFETYDTCQVCFCA